MTNDRKDVIAKVIDELRTYIPEADKYMGRHILKGWADRLEAAALSQPSPAVPVEQLATYRPVWLQYGATMHRDVVPNEAGWLKRSDVLDLLAAPQPAEQSAMQAGSRPPPTDRQVLKMAQSQLLVLRRYVGSDFPEPEAAIHDYAMQRIDAVLAEAAPTTEQPATQAGVGDRQMKECADHMDWLAARLTEVHGEKFNRDYILAARRWAGWLRHKAAPTTEQPATRTEAVIHENEPTNIRATLREQSVSEYELHAHRDTEDDDWYIIVTDEGGYNDYNGVWQDSAGKTCAAVLAEAADGAQIAAPTTEQAWDAA